jgi:hypothetical protein
LLEVAVPVFGRTATNSAAGFKRLWRENSVVSCIWRSPGAVCPHESPEQQGHDFGGNPRWQILISTAFPALDGTVTAVAIIDHDGNPNRVIDDQLPFDVTVKWTVKPPATAALLDGRWTVWPERIGWNARPGLPVCCSSVSTAAAAGSWSTVRAETSPSLTTATARPSTKPPAAEST